MQEGHPSFRRGKQSVWAWWVGLLRSPNCLAGQRVREEGGSACLWGLRPRRIHVSPRGWHGWAPTSPGHPSFPILSTTFAAIPLPLPGTGPNIALNPSSFLSMMNHSWRAPVGGQGLVYSSLENTKGQAFLSPPLCPFHQAPWPTAHSPLSVLLPPWLSPAPQKFSSPENQVWT